MLPDLRLSQSLAEDLFELPSASEELGTLSGVEVFGCGERRGRAARWHGGKEVGEG